ncbi:MAG TPA: TonB-dependent siderophore receptor [Terriglobales bacterium]
MSQSRIKAKPKPESKNKTSKMRGPTYWMAVGTLAAYTTLGGKGVTKAYAQQGRATANPSVISSGQTQSLTVRRFDIAPGTLEIVLAAFERDSGIHMLLPNDSMKDIGSPGVSGLYTPESALKKLLTGTGISYHFTAPGTATLGIEKESTVVEVTAPTLQETLAKLTQALVDTPQSIDVVPQHIIQDQGATTLRDALRNVAGISLAAGEGGAQGDSLTIRGFTARNDLFVDGMRDFGSYYRDPFDTQEVAVLQGPSSVTFGRGSTGGVVNQETKTPGLDTFVSGDVVFGTDQTKRITTDIDKPLPSLGTGAAFRLNLMGDDNGVAGRDVTESRRVGIAPSLAFGLGTPTRWTFSYLHQWSDDIPDYGIPWLFNGPSPVPRNNYYGFEHGNYLKTNVQMGTAKFEHDFSPNITFRNQARYAHYARNVRITEAQITGTFDGAALNPSTDLDDIVANRHEIAVNSLETFLDDQADVTFQFHTGFLRHNLVSGVEASRETSAPVRPTYVTCTPTVLTNCTPFTSLEDPDPSEQFEGTISTTTYTHVDALSAGAYVLDTMRFGQKWELTGGARVDWFDADFNQFAVPTPTTPPTGPQPPFSQVVTKPSWRGALVYKPAQNGSIYFDYGTSFNPSAEALSLSASTQQVAPEENRTYEVGTKWDLFARKISLRSAIFQTTKTNARETDPTNALLTVLSGTQRVNGFEAQVSGKVTSRWELLSSYAYLDSKLTASQFFPAAIGAQLANVPHNTFSVWSNYSLPWRLGVGGGADFVDSRTASSTAPFDPVTGLVKQVPGYWVLNAMVKRPITERLELRANIYNLADKYYYDQIHPAHIVPGAARSALIGLDYKF